MDVFLRGSLYHHSRFSSLVSNRMKRVVAFGVTAFLLFSLNAQNALAELVLFDADVHPATKLRHFSQPWTKGSDIVPVSITVEKDGGRMLEITYTGRQGAGTTMVNLNKDEINSLQNMRPGGIKLLVDYDQEDFSKLNVISFFTDGSTLTTKITLEKGLNEYPVTSGWRKAATPLRWELLSKIYIESASPNLKWRLKKVAIMEAETKSVTLAIDKARKVHEVLPVSAKVNIDGMLDEWSAVKQLTSYCYLASGTEVLLPDSPFKVKLCYDDENLYVASSSAFPTPPLALKTKPDDNIWEDEALELFFSSELDNNRFIQFDVNHRGAVFDYIREFDVVTQMIGTKKEWKMKHVKAFTYKGKTLNAEMAFPFSELKFDRKTNNILEFQIAQDYADRADEALKTLAWVPAKQLPAPKTFGVLVFNSKPFGSGNVSVESIAKDAADGTDMTLACTLSDFVPGEYTVVTTTMSPDVTATASEHVALTGEKLSRNFIVRDGLKNKNSSYTCFFKVVNQNGDARVTAVNFDNSVKPVDLFGKKLFFPEPKRVQWNDGEFFAGDASTLYLEDDATPRTVRTAEIFANKYFGYTGRKLAIKKGAPSDIGGILFKIAKTAQYNGNDEPLKKEGYLLSVSKDRVTLVGGDEPGLYYAGVTFFQLLRNTMKIRDRHPVACVDIIDWPDIQNRSILFNGQWSFGGVEIKEYATGDDLIEWTDRYVSGTKLNLLFLNVWAMTKFNRRPEFNTNPRASFTLDDIARLAAFCRDNFIEPVPCFQIGSHCDGWLLKNHPELREKGFSVQADVTHPNHDSIVYDCFQDVIEAMNPKYFSPIGDEWWQKGKPGEKAEELLGGKPRNRVFLEWHVKLNNWLKEKGVQMLLFHDMLTPFHNGKVFDTYKIADEFPRDVIIASWADQSYTHPQFFYDRGFTLWINATGNALWDTEREKINSYGLGLYDGWFGTRCLMARSYARAGRTVTYPRLFRLSDWAWNFR
ncbi:MAG: glycoside hydrolase family 20 zincin-like fold domain-containing protein, partial [Victivallales bacterium]